MPGRADDVSHALAALRLLVIGGLDLVLFIAFARIMRIREVTTVLDTVLHRRRGRHVAS
jgi:putative peptidoglycan lipid II flippase